jgi:hypothetical protein
MDVTVLSDYGAPIGRAIVSNPKQVSCPEFAHVPAANAIESATFS